MDLSPGLDALAIGGDHGDDADELSLALSIGHILGVFQQQKQSAPIIQRIIKPVAGRVDARLTVQGVHCNAGVICLLWQMTPALPWMR